MDTDRIKVSLKNLGRLSEASAGDVQWLASTLQAVWPNPRLSPEAKLLLTDDVAALYLQFGHDLLQQAIDDMRQTSERRPMVSQLRSRCQDLHGSQKAPQSDEMRQYFRDLANHPEDFVPIALIVRDVMIRVKSKREWSQEEIWKQCAATQKEWAQVVRAGSIPAYSEKFSLAVIERARVAGQ